MSLKTIITLTAALGLTMSAYANIGDTVKQSNNRYGTPDKRQNGEYISYIYVKGNWNVNAGFNDKGRCVYIDYSHVDGSDFSKEDIVKLLADNAVDANHPFVYYKNNTQYATWWDGLSFYAMYLNASQTFRDGRTRTVPDLRITNQATLKELGLWPDAPSQNSDVNNPDSV